MLSCRAATELMEKRHLGAISFTDRLRLWVHLSLCAACRRYQKHSAALEKLFRRPKESLAEPVSDEQARELEDKILQSLEERE